MRRGEERKVRERRGRQLEVILGVARACQERPKGQRGTGIVMASRVNGQKAGFRGG